MVAGTGDEATASSPGRWLRHRPHQPTNTTGRRPAHRTALLGSIALIAVIVTGCTSSSHRDQVASEPAIDRVVITHDNALMADTTSRRQFCQAGTHFQLGEGEHLSAAERLELLQTMQATVVGPEDLRNALHLVLDTFETHSVNGLAQLAGVRVGQYIEGTCPGVNIAGAR